MNAPMTDTITEAFPDLERVKQFFPLGVSNPGKLTRDQIRQFNERGYVFPLDVFSPAEMREHRAYFDRVLETALAKGWNSYSINGWHKHLRSIWDLCHEARILDYVQDLLGEDLICWGTHYFCKLPGDGKPVSWHQDASFWPLSPSKTVTVWLAIDDADEANGAMRILPGTHHQGQVAFSRSAEAENNVLGQTVNELDRYDVDPVYIELKTGQISLHTDWVLHGSEPNRSQRRRCGLTMRFVSPDVEGLEGWNQQGILCRGQDRYGHWPSVPRPENDIIPEPTDG